MDTIPISKENKKKLWKFKKIFGYKYTYQAIDTVIDIANKVYEKNPEQISEFYKNKHEENK